MNIAESDEDLMEYFENLRKQYLLLYKLSKKVRTSVFSDAPFTFLNWLVYNSKYRVFSWYTSGNRKYILSVFCKHLLSFDVSLNEDIIERYLYKSGIFKK